MHTVVHTDNETRIIVNSKYLPSNGMASDVGGIISARSKKKTVKETRMEMQSVTLTKIDNIRNVLRDAGNQHLPFRPNPKANKTPTLS
jgi:hypothetical protein